MSSPSERFECRWQRSRALMAVYLGALALALICIALLHIPFWATVVSVLLCGLHALRCLPSLIRADGERAYRRLRRDRSGWQLWNQRDGWQAVQLRPDSMALPLIVIVRFRSMDGTWLNRHWVRSVCIPRDAMAPDAHRRLRLRLKFSRRRWAAPE